MKYINNAKMCKVFYLAVNNSHNATLLKQFTLHILATLE